MHSSVIRPSSCIHLWFTFIFMHSSVIHLPSPYRTLPWVMLQFSDMQNCNFFLLFSLLSSLRLALKPWHRINRRTWTPLSHPRFCTGEGGVRASTHAHTHTRTHIHTPIPTTHTHSPFWRGQQEWPQHTRSQTAGGSRQPSRDPLEAWESRREGGKVGGREGEDAR